MNNVERLILNYYETVRKLKETRKRVKRLEEMIVKNRETIS